MTTELKAKLQDAMQVCDYEDKSTEYTIQYMQDTTGATHDEVMKFLREI